MCLSDRFDDGGFSGGNLDRPALSRLIARIKAGDVDCIVVYKVDRLSRSLLDFSRLVEVLDEHGTAFVSVTQPINTSDSAGRLMLNVLLSFAQYEREMISDRTRDKMCAARRRGKWTGGIPVLGYDIHPDGGKLVVNEDEARLIQEIFQLYLRHQSISKVCEILHKRGIRTKSWTTRKGRHYPGTPFSKSTLQRHLTNAVYIGMVEHKGERYPGEQRAIVQKRTFKRVREILDHNLQATRSRATNRYGALLHGLLRCRACGCTYVHSTTKKGPKVYRYYVCSSAQKRGYKTCPTPSIPAPQLEAAMVAQIKKIGQDPELQGLVLADAKRQIEEQAETLTAQIRQTQQERDGLSAEKRGLLKIIGKGEDRIKDLERIDGGLHSAETRIDQLEAQRADLARSDLDEPTLREALEQFEPIWDVLYPIEQARIIQLLVECIDYDGGTGTLGLQLSPAGISILADEMRDNEEGAA